MCKLSVGLGLRSGGDGGLYHLRPVFNFHLYHGSAYRIARFELTVRFLYLLQAEPLSPAKGSVALEVKSV